MNFLEVNFISNIFEIMIIGLEVILIDKLKNIINDKYLNNQKNFIEAIDNNKFFSFLLSVF